MLLLKLWGLRDIITVLFYRKGGGKNIIYTELWEYLFLFLVSCKKLFRFPCAGKNMNILSLYLKESLNKERENSMF